MSLVLLAPPLVLLLLVAIACAWLTRGDRERDQRQAQISDSLRPRREMGPSPYGPRLGRRARSSQPISASHSRTERSS